MLEELVVAFVIGLSFSNAFVCILLAFGLSSAEQKSAVIFFILVRFLGVLVLGVTIALVGVVFDGYLIYFLILFAALTMIFGALVIIRLYLKTRKQATDHDCSSCERQHKQSCPGNVNINANAAAACQDAGACNDTGACNEVGLGRWLQRKTRSKILDKTTKITKRYSFVLGVFRGATPCLKIFILAPLLIVVDLPVALLMIVIYAGVSTIYPVIGFLSANLLTNFKKYESYVQAIGALTLISIGVYTIFKQLMVQSCAVGI